MLNKLSKHLRVWGNNEDDIDDVEEDSVSDEPQTIDPRWNELKKILDNN